MAEVRIDDHTINNGSSNPGASTTQTWEKQQGEEDDKDETGDGDILTTSSPLGSSSSFDSEVEELLMDLPDAPTFDIKLPAAPKRLPRR